MKKVWKLMVLCVSVMMLAGCGAKEQSVKLTADQDGTKMETVLEAKGDIVSKMTQTSILNIAGYTEEDIAMLEQAAQTYADTFLEAGAEYTYDITDTEFKEVMTVDLTNSDSMDKLSAAGVLPVDGNGDKVSLKMTIENLEKSGMKVVE